MDNISYATRKRNLLRSVPIHIPYNSFGCQHCPLNKYIRQAKPSSLSIIQTSHAKSLDMGTWEHVVPHQGDTRTLTHVHIYLKITNINYRHKNVNFLNMMKVELQCIKHKRIHKNHTCNTMRFLI